MLINTNYFTLTWPKTTLVYFHIRVSHSALSTLQFKSSGCYTIEGALNDRSVIFCSHSCLICRNSVSSRCNSYFKFFIRSRFLAARWHQTSRVWRRAATCSLDNKDAVRSIPLCHCQSELNRQNSRLSCWYFLLRWIFPVLPNKVATECSRFSSTRSRSFPIQLECLQEEEKRKRHSKNLKRK